MIGLIFAGQGAQGPDAPTDTRQLQPWLAGRELALLAALTARGVTCGAVAGFSLGEWPALAAAGILTPDEVLELVALRAGAMADAAEASPGGMAALLGLPADAVEDLCRQVAAPAWASPANYNAPGQTVVSGNPEGLAAVILLAKERGAKGIPLKVSGAFHSRAMEPAAAALHAALASYALCAPALPWYPNLTGTRHPGGIPDPALLARQCAEPVRWEATVRAMLEGGVTAFLELGPGAVLTGLVKRIAPGIPCACAPDEAALEAALGMIGG